MPKADIRELISTHALTEGDTKTLFLAASRRISTHALTEGDGTFRNMYIRRATFQLTPSRRATRSHSRCHIRIHISTHALTEGDHQVHQFPMRSAHFNSRPHGGRPYDCFFCGILRAFQLTPSRRATIEIFTSYCVLYISTHALTEGDAGFCEGVREAFSFQLTPSRRATITAFGTAKLSRISTHALTEGDLDLAKVDSSTGEFQLTPSRRATIESGVDSIYVTFQLTPSRRATKRYSLFVNIRWISTHALTEGDVTSRCLRLSASYFNSRPHGGRR